MRSVNKKTEKQLLLKFDELKNLLEQQREYSVELEAAIQDLIENFKDSHGNSHNDYVEKILEVRNEIDETTGDIMSRIEDYADNRSGSWQEGESGSKYRTWYEMWSDFNNEVLNATSVDEEITFDLTASTSSGVDEFLELPPSNVCEVEASYRCW